MSPRLDLARIAPGLAQLRDYRLAWLGGDVAGGLAVAAVAVPIGVAYPAIMGIPPQYGLFATILGMLAYAVFGPSRRVIVGPDTATTALLATTMVQLGASSPTESVQLAALLAVLVGLLMIAAGMLRLGVIADFLSRPVLLGFVCGVALSLFVGQLGRLTAVPIDSRGLLRPLLELAGKTAQIHGPTLVLGLGLFVLLRLLQRVAPRVPGPLVALLLAIALSWSLGLPDLGLAVVGPVPAGLPAPDLPVPSGLAFEKVLAAALGVFLVAFSSGIVTARTFVARTRERVDANRELVGFGTANLAAGLFGGFAVTGASSRTAVNLLAGAQTQLAGLIAAAALALALLFLTAPLALLPTAALGAILASAAVDLFDLPGLRRLWRVSRPEFAFAMLAVAGVVLLGALEGVAVAVAATLLHLLVLSARPRDALLGRIPGRGGFHKLHQEPAARPVPGMVIYAPQGSLLFFSADHIRRRILWIARQQPAGTRWFLIDAAAVPLIDTSAADMLDEVRDELAGLGMSLCFAKLHARPLRTLRRTGLVDRIGPEQVFSRLGAAHATLAAR